MKLQLNQLRLITALTQEVQRQADEQELGPVAADSRTFNALIDAANLVLEAFGKESVPATPGMGLTAWLRCDDTGESSECLCWHLFGQRGPHLRRSGRPPKVIAAHPRDPADFGRCHRFLLAVGTAARPMLGDIMPKVSPVWAKLAEHWDELTALYIEELPTGKCPKTYALMQELGC